jgi:hypothetical protein
MKFFEQRPFADPDARKLIELAHAFERLVAALRPDDLVPAQALSKAVNCTRIA